MNGEMMTSSSPEASHANHTQQQASDLGKKTIDISGLKCSESFQKLSQPTSWAKMFAASLIGTGEWSSRKCALTWKILGTKYNRYYCQLVPLAHRIAETGFGLLPSESMLPTPTAMDSTNATANMKSTQVKEGSMHSVTLSRAMAMGMLPTPATRDYKGGKSKEILDKRKERGNFIETLPNKFAIHGKTSQLNPRFVAEMMGFPPDWTQLPFQSGETNQSKPMETP